MKDLIYDHEKRLRYSMSSLERSELSERNRKLILDFVDDRMANGLSKSRLSKYIYHLMRLANWMGKDLDTASAEDIKSLVRNIEESPFVEFTKSELKMVLKKFFMWMRQSEEYPPEVKWIRPRMKKVSKIKMPEELLTEDDVKAMVQASGKHRDRALIATFYESGCRLGELLPLKLRHVSFDEYGAQILVDGKTGARRIRLIASVPHLHNWLNNHPYRENPDSFVWAKSDGHLLSEARVRYLMVSLANKAGVKKKIFPHLFRHSRATYLANHLTEARMKEYFGWVQESDMAGIYVHLSGRDLDDAILKVHGRSRPETRKESALTPKICERCQTENAYTNAFCSRCGYVLDEATRLQFTKGEADRKKADNILDELIKDKEFRELFIRKLEGLNTGQGK